MKIDLMSANEVRKESKRSMITVRAVLFILAIIVLPFLMAPTAQAAGVPTKLIVFTDRQIYTDGYYNGQKNVPAAGSSGNNPYNLTVYAIILDDDGNIMKGRSSNLSGKYNTSSILNHWSGAFGAVGDANWVTYNRTHHTNVTTNSDLINGMLLAFTDSDNDGIYISTRSPLYIPATYYDEHFMINVTVNESVLGTSVYPVMLTRLSCHSGQGDPTGENFAHGSNHNPEDTCAICHHGYEHQYENISEGIPATFRSAHLGKMNPTDYTTSAPRASGYIWNVSWSNSGKFTPGSYQWSKWTPGAQYCYSCHYDSSNTNQILDMQDATGDRPSCSQATSPVGTTCHASTEMESASLTGVSWTFIANPGVIPNLTAKIISKSHNHSSNTKGVPCSLCHLDFHNNRMPNASASRTNINEQCWLCHSGTGPKDSSKFAHSSSTTGCKSCHKNATGVLDVHLIPIASSGGANCTDCHTLTGANKSTGGGKLINSTAMNSSSAIHKNLNRLGTRGGVPAENLKCWACHGNGSKPAGEHPDNYKTPYNCIDCHIQGAGQNFNYTPNNTLLNVSQHYWNATSIHTPAAATCYLCHNRSEMMLGTTLDPDGAGTVYSGANGGNESTSHYGKNRTDLRTWNSGRAVNCSYCHQNASTVFSSAMLDPAYNRSIRNHSASNSPVCFNSTCHGSGWIHNSTLTRPSMQLPNSSYCQLCHSEKQKHGGSQNCSLCHINTSSNDTIHPIKYLQANGSFITSNASAVNCSSCHQGGGLSGFGSAPGIPNPLKHSSNASNGTIWGTYWNYSQSASSSCHYCHNDTRHNATALGTVNFTLNSYNLKNGSLTTTQWCADCHYNDSINTDFKGSLWDPDPPYISYDNTLKSGWADHSDYFSGGYNDSICLNCHAINGSYAATSLNYSHSLDPGMGGGPNCITCHNLVTGLSGGAPVGINFTAANASSHNGTNINNATQRGFAPIVGACWACHDSDGNVTSGHPDRYKNPRTCTECHLGTGTYNTSAYNALIVSEHYSNGTDIKAGNSTTNISSCINCHENISEMILYNNDTDYGSFTGDGIRLKGGNQSFYHYGKNRTDIRTGNSANCSYCHRNSSTAFAAAMINASYNRSISNHSSFYNSTNPNCISSQCHNTGWMHNSSLVKPAVNSTFCFSCHGSNGAGGMNYTGAVTGIKEKHNNNVNCTECHMDTMKDIHPVKYLLQDAAYSTLNASSVTCITCHQTTSVDSKLTLVPPKIPAPMHHSDNASNGTLWNSTSYWTLGSPLTSCTYCHNDTRHNATALGRPFYWKGSNAVNSTINGSTWCSSCHFQSYVNGSRSYADMTSQFISGSLPVPPEITTGSYASKIFNRSDYYNHSLKGYTDEICRLCHGINLSPAVTISEFTHNVTEVSTCTGCHYSWDAMNSTRRPDRYVEFSMYNTSLHRSLSCENCHTKGHRNMGARKACEDCHAVQANPITEKGRHNITATPSTYFVSGNNVVSITDCTICHDSILYGKSISTYGYWKQKDCDYCHTYPDKYYE